MSDEQINEVMDSFDFASVAVAMRALNWTWVHATAEDGIPTERELRQTARRLLRDCEPERFQRTGGFTAWREDDVYGLEFAVERYDTGMSA